MWHTLVRFFPTLRDIQEKKQSSCRGLSTCLYSAPTIPAPILFLLLLLPSPFSFPFSFTGSVLDFKS